MKSHLAFAVGLSVAAYACGGGDGGGNTDPVTVSSAAAGCGSICEAEIRCGSTETQAECTTDCQSGIDGWVREDALEIMADCYASLPCDGDDSTCFGMVPALAEHREWNTRCTADLATCDGFDADICAITPGSGDTGLILLFAPVVMNEMIDCLDGADCTARGTCIQNVFVKYGIDG